MKEKSKENWLEVIKSFGFSVDKHEMILNYIDNHLRYEVLQMEAIVVNTDKSITRLVMALKVLSKLDLDRVKLFQYIGDVDTVETSICLPPDVDLSSIPDPDIYVENIIVKKTVEMLNKMLDEGELFIDVLFSYLHRIEHIIIFNHRLKQIK